MTVSDISAPFPDPIPYDRQAVEIPGTRKPGQTGHYRNSIWGLVNSKDPRVCSTLDLVFERALKHCRNSRCLGYRPRISKNPLLFADHYVWQTFAEVDARRKAIGSALLPMFLNGECGAGEALKTVGLWSVNRPEWQIIDFAAHAYQLCIVTLYDTLGPDSVEYVIQHSHLSIICCSSDHIPTLLQLAPKVPVLKVIVSLDDLDPDICTMTAAWAESVGVRVITLNEVETIGREKPLPPIRAKAEDIASICYTSGTTGNPKGALLSHRALAISSCVGNWGLVLPKEGTNLSYLPLAHIYGRILDLNVIAVGAAVGYFSGDNLRILEDAQILKPDLFASVPRVLNRLYQAIMAAGDAPGFKGALFRKAMQAKLEKWKATGDNTHAFWDRLVFRKIQVVLGGNVKTILSGSAPVSADVMHFLNIAFSCDCEEGYGLTETCASFSKLWPLDVKGVGTVGPPSPYNEVKLVDVPEMNYTAEDKPFPRGEICIRGDNCFTGYYKNEEATKKAIDADGWFHTGDVGLIDSAGRVKIIDRVKNIMKLAQGEYVALEKIENMYSTCPVVQQIYVHGDSLQSFLVGVVVPDPVQLASMASKMTGKPVRAEDVTALAEACFNEGVIQGVFDALSREAKRNGLKGFECVKRIHLTMDPFTVEDNTLTPTLKLRRRDAHNKFKTEIERMYKLGEPSTPPSLAKL